MCTKGKPLFLCVAFFVIFVVVYIGIRMTLQIALKCFEWYICDTCAYKTVSSWPPYHIIFFFYATRQLTGWDCIYHLRKLLFFASLPFQRPQKSVRENQRTLSLLLELCSQNNFKISPTIA